MSAGATLPFQLFGNVLADHRAVCVPPGLNPDRRARFIAKIAAAVRQQAELAQRTSSVLRVTGTVEDAGERLLIPHEPAIPLDPQAVLETKERADLDTLWWLTAAGIQALALAANEKALHGGIQLGALLLDEAGRPKLSDFGLAPAFESALDIDARRWVHCDAGPHEDEQGRKLSAIWRLLPEDEPRDDGWIAPYFGHELLEGRLRLNLKADQFAFGTLLFLLATGTHPYGAAWSDPSLHFYFQLEPSPLAEERPDWAEAFERHRAGIAQPTDRAIVAWAQLVERLLASDAERRFASLTPALSSMKELLSPAWAKLADEIDGALAILEDGDAATFLERLMPWTQNPAVPWPWREQLRAWATRIDAQKDTLRAQQARRRLLAAAHQALDLIELDKARQAARQLADDPDADESQRAAAAEVLRLCDEQESFIASGADALAAAYLDTARESLAGGDLEAARQVLHGVLGDPGMPPTRTAHARQLLGEVELTAERLERQQADLAAAVAEAERFDYDAAREKLELLLADPHLLEQVAPPARTRLETVRHKQQARAAALAALDEADAAWNRADPVAMDGALAHPAAGVDDPALRPRRTQLVERMKELRSAIDQQRAAERSLAEDRPTEAIATIQRVGASATLPETLRVALRELSERCQHRVAEQRDAALAAAGAALHAAHARLSAGDTGECRRLLDGAALRVPDLPVDLRRQADDLRGRCQIAERAAERLRHAQDCLSREDFAAATGWLDQVPMDSVPTPLAEQTQALRAALASAREALSARQRQLIQQRLDEIAAAITTASPRQTRSALREIGQSPYLTDALRQRAADLQTQLSVRRRKQKPLPAIGIGAALVLMVGVGLWVALRPRAPEQRPPSERQSQELTQTPASSLPAEETPPRESRVPPVVATPATEPVVEVAPPTQPPDVAQREPAETPPTTTPVVVEAPPPPDTQPAEPPVRTLADASTEFLVALRTALPEKSTPRLSGSPESALSVEVRWQDRDLLPYTGLSFDAARGEFSPAPDTVVAWFRPQVVALETLQQAQNLPLRVDEQYDAALTLTRLADVRLVGFDPQTGATQVVVPARLRADPRDDAHFDLHGTLLNQTLTADEPGQAAFRTYLQALQQHQAKETLETIAPQLRVPQGLELVAPRDFAGADQLALTLSFGQESLASLTAAWDASSLTYALEAAPALDAIRAGVARLAGTEQTRAKLMQRWPDVVQKLALPESAPGALYFGQCQPVELQPQTSSDSDAFAIPIRVTVRPKQTTEPADGITLVVRAGFFDGVFTWDTSALPQLKKDLTDALENLAASAAFRQRRELEATTELAGRLRPPVQIKTTRDADTLRAEVLTAGQRTNFEWTWDARQLRYGEPRELAPPSLDQQLARLASLPAPGADDFVAALRDVTTPKAASYAVQPYRLGPELTDANLQPKTALTQLSQALQALIAPNPAADRFPTVFVEFYVGEQHVYGLAWHAVTKAKDEITDVADLRVWSVMPVAELRQFKDADAFRSEYSTNAALGERLLGSTLSPPGQPIPASAGGSFGVVVAPQGVLWSVRWEQVQFTPRAVRGLAPDPGRVQSLAAVLAPVPAGRQGQQVRRAGLWCVPTLAGAWHGPTQKGRMGFTIDNWFPEKNAPALAFDARGADTDKFLFAYIEIPGGRVDFQWGDYATQVHRNEIGCTFWNRPWPTPFVSFALLRVVRE